MKKEKKGYQTLNVYQEIKRKIIMLALKPGEVLEEKQLGSELGVGRTPVREALLLLKSENLVESQPNKGTYVKEMTLKGIKDLFESLTAIEELTTCLAAQKITQETLRQIEKIEQEINESIGEKDHWGIITKNRVFHALIAQSSDNQHLISFNEMLRNEAQRLSYLAVSKDLQNNQTLDQHLANIMKQHREIVTCLENREVKRLKELSIEHNLLFQRRIMSYISGGSLLQMNLEGEVDDRND